jgi:hypothetical protein
MKGSVFVSRIVSVDWSVFVGGSVFRIRCGWSHPRRADSVGVTRQWTSWHRIFDVRSLYLFAAMRVYSMPNASSAILRTNLWTCFLNFPPQKTFGKYKVHPVGPRCGNSRRRRATKQAARSQSLWSRANDTTLSASFRGKVPNLHSLDGQM